VARGTVQIAGLPETDLVFDGQDESPVGAQQRTGVTEEIELGPEFGGRGPGVFEDPDDHDEVESRRVFEVEERTADDLHVCQVRAAGGNGLGPDRLALEGNHLGSAFAQVAGDRAGSGADFEDSMVFGDLERTQDVAAPRAEVIGRRPIDRVTEELVGAVAVIGDLTESRQHIFLGAIGVASIGSQKTNRGCGFVCHPVSDRDGQTGPALGRDYTRVDRPTGFTENGRRVWSRG